MIGFLYALFFVILAYFWHPHLLVRFQEEMVFWYGGVGVCILVTLGGVTWKIVASYRNLQLRKVLDHEADEALEKQVSPLEPDHLLEVFRNENSTLPVRLACYRGLIRKGVEPGPDSVVDQVVSLLERESWQLYSRTKTESGVRPHYYEMPGGRGTVLAGDEAYEEEVPDPDIDGIRTYMLSIPPSLRERVGRASHIDLVRREAEQSDDIPSGCRLPLLLLLGTPIAVIGGALCGFVLYGIYFVLRGWIAGQYPPIPSAISTAGEVAGIIGVFAGIVGGILGLVLLVDATGNDL